MTEIAPKLKTTRVPMSTLTKWPGNARRGDVEKIKKSMLVNGVFHPLDVQRGTNKIIIGNHRYMAMQQILAEHPDDVRFDEYADVIFHDVDHAEALRMHLSDNSTGDAATWEERLLAEQLAEVEETTGSLDGTGFTDDYMHDLLHKIEETNYETEREAQYDEGNAATPVKRETPLDLIFSSSGEATRGVGLIAFNMGWNPGIISTYVGAARSYRERFPRNKPIMFMDNEWHGYDHDEHVTAVAEFKPKYATTRDIMTKQQCEDADVEFFTLDEILSMAADIAQHAQNVILIPKYDCLDKLPREINGKPVVLGYSVESSYGGTQLPPDAFKGWPVHLLGGPWKKQRAILNILRDDVVSLDNNNVLMTSRFGSVALGDGTTKNILDVLPYKLEVNHMIVSLVLSLANIIAEVHSIYGVEVEAIADAQLIETVEQETENDR